MGISNVVALNKVVASHKTAPLDDVVQAINIKLGLSVTADNKAASHRLAAGRMLLDLRRRVEAEGDDWWKWQQGKFTRSRKDIEKLMRMANADEPEAAAKAERTINAEQHRSSRAKRNGADVRAKPQPPPVPDIIEEACDYCRTDEERWQYSLGFHAGQIVALRAYWQREFGDWQKFEVPSSLVTLAKQAAKEWSELVDELQREERDQPATVTPLAAPN
jgi:hypothetical protein